ncbi:MAG: hypothetical protein AAGA11_13515 [Pseudomonadota bacterium]
MRPDAAQVYSVAGLRPVVDPGGYVHPTAVLVGDVIIGPECDIGPNSVLRGDFGRARLSRAAHFQKTCVAHNVPGEDATGEDHGHIGHGAILHGCHTGENANRLGRASRAPDGWQPGPRGARTRPR